MSFASPSAACVAALDAVQPRTEIEFHVSKETDRIGSVDLAVHLPASSIPLNKVNGQWTASFDWYITQRNQAGKRFAEVWNGTIDLNLSGEALEQVRSEGYTFRRRVAPSDAAASLHIVICVGGRVGTQTIPIQRR